MTVMTIRARNTSTSSWHPTTRQSRAAHRPVVLEDATVLALLAQANEGDDCPGDEGATDRVSNDTDRAVELERQPERMDPGYRRCPVSWVKTYWIPWIAARIRKPVRAIASMVRQCRP